MKKTMAILLCVLMLVPFATIAFAESTTTLTTVVPGAAYTLNIPADQTIDYGATSTQIGNITVTDSSGFAVDKNLCVTLTYDAFTCPNTETTIPFSVIQHSNYTEKPEVKSGDTITFLGLTEGTVEEKAVFLGYGLGRATDYSVDITSEDWGKAIPGTYTATITFTAEVANA